MIVKTKLTERDFVNVNLVLLYKRLWVRYLTVIAGLGLLLYVSAFFYDAHIENPGSGLPFIAVVLLGLPAMTYFQAKKNYKASRANETITYNFTDDYLEMAGESFTSKLTWEKFHKVTEAKEFILIWQNNYSANILLKQDVWEGERELLKELLDKHRVKNNLKSFR